MAGTDPLVLQVGQLRESLVDSLSARYRTASLPTDASSAVELLDRCGSEVAIAVTSSKTGIGNDVLARLPSLGAIVNFGVGCDRIDLAETKRRGIPVSITRGVLENCVADTAVAMLLSLLRELPQADAFVRSGAWTSGQFPPATGVAGTRVGILGLGAIGGAVARRLEPFGAEIEYHGRHQVAGAPYRYHPDVLGLAKSVDALVVTVAGNAGTTGIVSDEVLDALRGGWLVNVARGSSVDQAAMIRRLRDGDLRGAGLDVFVGEPEVPPELCELPNVILLPHIGAATVRTQQAMRNLVIANIDRFLTDGTLVTTLGG
jgi:hydroxypyruvate reductase